jgi:hypothetical protein
VGNANDGIIAAYANTLNSTATATQNMTPPIALVNQTAAPSAVSGAGTIYSLAGQPQWENPQGLTGSVPGCQGGLATAGIVTVNTTSAETVLQSFSIPAADPVAGSVYQMVGWGVYGTTGTPTLAWGSRWGGVSGTSLSTIDATTLGSSLTNVAFKIDCLLNFLSTTTAQVVMALDLSTSSTTNATTRLMNSPSAAVTVSATAAKVWVTTVTFSASNASNTISLLGAYTLRLA